MNDAGNAESNELIERFRASKLRVPEGQRPTPTADAIAEDGAEYVPGWGDAVTPEELDAIPDTMRSTFFNETADDLQDLRGALLALEQQGGDRTIFLDMERIAHKIKGAAGTVKLATLTTLAHTFEDMLLAVHGNRVPASAPVYSVLFRYLDLLQADLDRAGGYPEADAVIVGTAETLREELLALTATSAALPGPPRPSTFAAPAEREEGARPTRALDGQSLLRVDVGKLDGLMDHVSALATNRAVFKEIREGIARLQTEMDQALARIRDVGGHIADVQPLMRPTFPLAAHDDGAPLSGAPARADLELARYSDLDQALRALDEAVADIAANSSSIGALLQRLGQTSETQETLMTQMQQDVTSIRLVPLQDLVPRLQVATRLLAEDLGKAVTFSVRGQMTEIDRDISEALAEPLLQLARNAIVHGIEPPDERRAAGKPEAGDVWLHAYYVGNEVTIEIGDDGWGVKPDMLVASAIALGILDADTGRALTPSAALDLMFKPGVSTMREVQAAGGRGIGLDEVRTAIQRLKGSIHVQSETGQGAIFRIRVPISLSIVRILQVRVGDDGYAVPFSSVAHSITLDTHHLVAQPAAPLASGGAAWARRASVSLPAEMGDRPGDSGAGTRRIVEVPVFPLAELLGFEYRPQSPQPALLVEVGQQLVALLVDDVRDDREVVVRALPRHLRRHAVRGATVTADGQMLLLLDLPALVAGVLGGAHPLPVPRPAARPAARPIAPPTPRVLVVDDSISMRTALQLILTRAGFEVQLARDGFEALSLMLAGPPRALLLDIEMPRLDGFELLAIVRGSPQFAEVRVAMLTTRSGEKHRRHAEELGADAYLTKPCPDELLVETVRRLLG